MGKRGQKPVEDQIELIERHERARRNFLIGKAASRQREKEAIRAQYDEGLSKYKPEELREIEKDPELWLRTMLPASFPLPFAEFHRQIIRSAVLGDEDGKSTVVAVERGAGKTTLLRGLILYLLCTKRQRFPVIAGWSFRSAKEHFQWFLNQMRSDQLSLSYPHMFMPFVGKSPAVITNEDTGARVESDRLTIVLPFGHGAISCGSLNGDVKGLSVSLKNGETIRPTMVLFDDCQDVDRASDRAFVDDVIHTMQSQWLGLAGPDQRMMALMACTIFAKNDVGETFGNLPDSRFIRFSRVISWPENFNEPDSETRRMWNECYQLRIQDSNGASVKYYLDHRDAMTKGYTTSWSERYSRKAGDPDALYATMVEYYRIGATSFFSEYQNTPEDTHSNGIQLQTSDVLDKMDANLARRSVPQDNVLLTCAVDLNVGSAGLTWSIVSWNRRQDARVIDYGIFPTKIPTTLPEADYNRAVYNALYQFMGQLKRLNLPIDIVGIDGNGTPFDCVCSFVKVCQQAFGMNVVSLVGRGGRTYNPAVRTRVGSERGYTYQCFDSTSRNKWHCWATDPIHAQALRMWKLPPGSPGGFSLFASQNHLEFAQQNIAEQLEYIVEFADRRDYHWNSTGTHDYSDSILMNIALASMNGYNEVANSLMMQAMTNRQVVPVAGQANNVVQRAMNQRKHARPSSRNSRIHRNPLQRW